MSGEKGFLFVSAASMNESLRITRLIQCDAYLNTVFALAIHMNN